MDAATHAVQAIADFGVAFSCGPDADFQSAPCWLHSGKTLAECGCPNICASDEWQAEQSKAHWTELGRQMARRHNEAFMKAMFGPPSPPPEPRG